MTTYEPVTGRQQLDLPLAPSDLLNKIGSRSAATRLADQEPRRSSNVIRGPEELVLELRPAA